jgi:exopolysaccharide biosynthesis polyprenyl glycosylphosphotransferase
MSKLSHLDISERKVLLRVVDVFLYILSLYVGVKFSVFTNVDFSKSELTIWMITFIIYSLLFGEIFQLYNLEVSNNRFKVVRSIFLTTFLTTFFYFITPFITPSLPGSRIEIFYFFLFISFPVILWRFAYLALFYAPKYFKNILIVGHSEKIKTLLYLIREKGFHHVQFYLSDERIDGFNGFKDVRSNKLSVLGLNSSISEVIVSNENLEKSSVSRLNKEIISLYKKGVDIKSFDDFYEEITERIPRSYLDIDFYTKMKFSRNNENRFYLFSIRFLEVILSIVGLIFFILFLPFICLGNILANRGPLFYTQVRVGKKGRDFKIHKLRTMIKNAERNGAVWSTSDDHRITFFGRFLRSTRLDEVPQFFNILKGEMSLIGPRPERPQFVKYLEEEIPYYAIRHVIKPGLTGWAQVNYPYANTMKEQEIKLRYDLFYIKERNFFLDFKIFIKTITTVLFFKGQ